MKNSILNRRYSWKPQLPDYRDRAFVPRKATPSVPTVDLRPQMPPVYDQTTLGSCTANAIGSAVEYDLMRQKLPVFTPSRLFIYYNERDIEGTVGVDAGAAIRDGIKTINSFGVCPEPEWPYDVTQFTVKPTLNAYMDALHAKSVSYGSVNQDLESIKDALTQATPVVIGFTVYEGFESDTVAKSGMLALPDANESCLGGHAVLIVGVNDTQADFQGIPAQHFAVRNSWGSTWGTAGYFFAPFEYFLNPNLASDLWAITVMA